MKKNILTLSLFISFPLMAEISERPSFDYTQGVISPRDLDTYKSESDRQIVISIRNKIDDGSNRYDRVRVAVQGGVVTLRGWAPSQADIDYLLTSINSVPDVTAVNNYLKIVPEAPAPPQAPTPSYNLQYPRQNDTFATASDREIVLTIRRYINASHTYDHVYLSVTEGRVILEGWLESTSDADSLIRHVTNIPGVKSIKTNLVIRNA